MLGEAVAAGAPDDGDQQEQEIVVPDFSDFSDFSFRKLCVADFAEGALRQYNWRMKPLNLANIAPADLMPLPEVPDRYGPRNADERRIYDRVKEGLDCTSGKEYASVADFIAELRGKVAKLNR